MFVDFFIRLIILHFYSIVYFLFYEDPLILLKVIIMLPSNSQESSLSYAYVGGMLNVAYLTGFVRNPHANGFMLQQTNNINHAIPITVEGKHRKFREKEPVTVICHAYGLLNENRDRSMELKAIKVEVPTLLTMPGEISWNSKLPESMKDEEFKPFGNQWQGKIKSSLAENETDHVNEIFEATGGRFDNTLGASSNSFRCAGFIEGYAMARDSNGAVVDDCLTLLIRQHKDPERSIPVRLYGRYAKTYINHLSIGQPVRVDGQVRVNAKMQEDGSLKLFTFVHTSQLRGSDQEVGIRYIPEWYADMKMRIISEMQARSKTKEKPAKLEEITSAVPAVISGSHVDDTL